jgi:glycosyltransferase involved in cell wall biosynthesis
MASGCPVLVSRKSGVAPLFDHTPAMRQVSGGAAAWAAALRAFCADRDGQRSMGLAALRYSAGRLASWGEVLEEDLFSIWRRSAMRDLPVSQAA